MLHSEQCESVIGVRDRVSMCMQSAVGLHRPTRVVVHVALLFSVPVIALAMDVSSLQHCQPQHRMHPQTTGDKT